MRWALAIAGLALAVPALAYTPTGYVNDFAHVLSAGTVQSLESDLVAFNTSTTNEIAVVTVPNMGGDYIEHYAEQLFKEWGIGTKSKDNGVLLLLSVEERKIRIEVGYGLEGALPDSVAASIINEMSPKLKAGDYNGAVTAAVASIEAATRGEYQSNSSAGGSIDADTLLALLFLPLVVIQWFAAVLARSRSWWAGGVVGLAAGIISMLFFGLALMWSGLLVVGVLTAFGLLLDFLVSRAYGRAKAAGIHPPWWTGGGSHSSGGSFGGFGGGSSGGGGASGGW